MFLSAKTWSLTGDAGFGKVLDSGCLRLVGIVDFEALAPIRLKNIEGPGPAGQVHPRPVRRAWRAVRPARSPGNGHRRTPGHRAERVEAVGCI